MVVGIFETVSKMRPSRFARNPQGVLRGDKEYIVGHPFWVTCHASSVTYNKFLCLPYVLGTRNGFASEYGGLRRGVMASMKMAISPPQRHPTESGRVRLYLSAAQNPTHNKFLCFPYVLGAGKGFSRLLQKTSAIKV